MIISKYNANGRSFSIPFVWSIFWINPDNGGGIEAYWEALNSAVIL